MPNRHDANQILNALLIEIDCRIGQVFASELTPLARMFTDCSQVEVRRRLLAELGVRDESVANAVHDACQQMHRKVFTECFDLPPECAALDDESLDKLLGSTSGSGLCWPRLHERYPRSRGVLHVSEPIYNAAGDLAIIYLGQVLGPKVGNGRVWSFRREVGWQIAAAKQIVVWIA